jgi:hypothetical protein
MPQLSWGLLGETERSQENFSPLSAPTYVSYVYRPTTLDPNLDMKFYKYEFCVVNLLLILGRMRNIVWENCRGH